MSKKLRIVHLVITLLPAFWFPFVINWLGESLSLVIRVQGEKQLSIIGLTLSIAIVISVIIIQIIFFNKSENIDYISLAENYKVLNRVEDSLINATKDKYKNTIEYIEENKDNIKHESFFELCDPVNNINKILEEITNLFVNILSIRSNNIGVTLAYRYCDEDTWHWFDESNVEDGLPLEDLMGNSNTTFYQLISGDHSIQFHASKKKARENGLYVYDNKDEENNYIGSIICAKVTCGKHKKEYISGVLSISTYGKEIIKDLKNKNEVEDFIKSNILDQFFIRIKLELAILYAKHVVKSD